MDKKYLRFPTKSSNFAPDKENDTNTNGKKVRG